MSREGLCRGHIAQRPIHAASHRTCESEVTEGSQPTEASPEGSRRLTRSRVERSRECGIPWARFGDGAPTLPRKDRAPADSWRSPSQGVHALLVAVRHPNRRTRDRARMQEEPRSSSHESTSRRRSLRRSRNPLLPKPGRGHSVACSYRREARIHTRVNSAELITAPRTVWRDPNGARTANP